MWNFFVCLLASLAHQPSIKKKEVRVLIHSVGDLLPQPVPSPLALGHAAAAPSAHGAAAATAPSCFLALFFVGSDATHERQLLDTSSLPVGNGVLGPLRPPA